MSEDCLAVNVVAPATAHESPLPVMVFIHGGGYMLGSAATPLYHGSALALAGCVFVSVGYRLGPLGCLDLSSLSTPQNRIDSNLFLRDLVLALQWVRDNIARFGGDPSRVTIFGESAGANAVATLVGVPAAAGLFHSAICQSPSYGLIQSADHAARTAHRFAAALAPSRPATADTVKSATASELVATLEGIVEANLRRTPGNFGIGATVDGDYLPTHPVDARADGQAHPVPLIVGHNAEEGRLFQRFMNYLPTNAALIERLLSDLDPSVRQRIIAAYPRYPDPAACLQLGGDFEFSTLAWRIAEAHCEHAPTYLYRYDYAPRLLSFMGLGATHATELLAVFGVYRSKMGAVLTFAGDQLSARRICDDVQRHWLSFSSSAVPGMNWPAYSTTHRAVMIFDRRSRVEIDPAKARRQAWETVTFT